MGKAKHSLKTVNVYTDSFRDMVNACVRWRGDPAGTWHDRLQRANRIARAPPANPFARQSAVRPDLRQHYRGFVELGAP